MNRSGNKTGSLAIAWLFLLAGSVLPASVARAQDGQPPTGRQPVITNQFTTTTGGALQARRPGVTIQQGIGVQQGSVDFFDGGLMPEDGFLQETMFIIMQSIFDSIMGILDTINLAAGLGGLADIFGLDGGGGTTQMTTVGNPTTTGQGTMTPVP